MRVPPLGMWTTPPLILLGSVTRPGTLAIACLLLSVAASLSSAPRPASAPAAAAIVLGSGNEGESDGRTVLEPPRRAAGPVGGRWRGSARPARRGPGGQVFLGHGKAEAESAGQRLRLPPPHLRRGVQGRSALDPAAAAGHGRGLPRLAAAPRADPQRRRAALHLRRREPAHPRRADRLRSDRAGGRRRRYHGDRRRAAAPARARRARHPLQPGAGRA